MKEITQELKNINKKLSWAEHDYLVLEYYFPGITETPSDEITEKLNKASLLINEVIEELEQRDE